MVKSEPDGRPLDASELSVLETFFRQGRDWVANPAAVEREGRVVRTTAGKVCENLAARGLLVHSLRRSKNRKDKTPHFQLKSGSSGFRRTALAYFDALRFLHGDGWSAAASLLSSQYAREELTPEFIRDVLVSRKVQMGIAVEAPPHLLRERDVFHGRAHRTFFLRLPLASKTGLNADSMARDAIRERESALDPLEPAARDFLESWGIEHYRTGELRRLILPILALCEVSPRALETFLSPWRAHDGNGISSGGSGFEAIDHVVFRMVFDAVADLSDARDVPSGCDVTFAEVCPEDRGVLPKTETLLQLTWKDEGVIGYSAGFDTDHTFYGPGEDDSGIEGAIMSGKPPEEWTADMLFGTDPKIVEVVRNPENAWVRVAWGRRSNNFFDPEVTDVEKRVYYVFRDRHLLVEALTHSTLANEDARAVGNQRLAHLGDAAVELVVRDALFRRFPKASKGVLTDKKKSLVSDSALAACATALELDKALAGGQGLVVGELNDTILAEAYEALMGAIYLDGGFDVVSRVVNRTMPLPLPEA